MSFRTALGAGFFSDEGLNVQTIFPPMPDRAGTFLLEGRADVALLAPPMYLPLIGEKEPIRVFANLLENDQMNLIVRREIAIERNLSADASLVERLEGIRGLKVGITPGPPVQLRVLFDSVGLDADQDLEMVILRGAEQNPAFEDGLVDALYAHSPFLEKAIVEQDAVILVDQSAGEVLELTDRQIHSLVAIRSYISDHRDAMVALTRAIHRAQQLIHMDQAATVDAILNSGIPNLDRTLVETIVSIYSPAIPETPQVSSEGIAKAHELFPAHRTAPDLTGIDLNDYVAAGIAEEAVAIPYEEGY